MPAKTGQWTSTSRITSDHSGGLVHGIVIEVVELLRGRNVRRLRRHSGTLAHLRSLTLHGDRHQSDDHVPRVWARDGGDDANGRVPLLLHVPRLLFAAATVAR